MELISISFILPTFNVEKTLSASLESILCQSFKHFEIIIIDAQSNDSTISIIKSYVEKHKKISWISEKDEGIYDAMNKGIKLAKGKWIYFIGGDDTLIHKNVLDHLFIKNDLCDYDVVYGNVISTRFNGRYDGEFSSVKILEQNICHQSIFFKKKVFRLTGQFDLKYKVQSDWDNNLKWFLNKKIKKKYVDLDIANYADGGFSSNLKDPLFSNDKKFNYLKYCLNSSKDNYILRFAKGELKKSLKSRNVKICYLSLYVLVKQLLSG